jgi:glycosyltransferase involved in cell wall biosynthesis
MRVRIVRFGDLSGSATSLVRHFRSLDGVDDVEDVDLLELRGMSTTLGRIGSRVEYELSARRWVGSKTGIRSAMMERDFRSAFGSPRPTVVVGTVPAFVALEAPYVVYTDRTYREGRRNDFGFRSRADPWWVAREATLLRRAEHVFTFGPSTIDSLVSHYGIEPERMSFVGAGMNIPMSRREASHEARSAVVKILFVGRQWKLHGGPELVEAMSTLDPSRFRLDVYGCSPTVTLPHVHVHGLVDGSAVSAAMANSDIYVRASRQDAFPIAIVEALSYGVPVVCSSIGNQPWMIGTAGRVVMPGDVHQLATAIDDVAAILPEAKRLASARAEQLAEYLSWDSVARTIADRLQEAAA